AFGQVPGGFTGVRVACGIAQGIAFALENPVVPVVSLMAVAQRDADAAPEQEPVIRIVVQDARMGEVYLAAYSPLPEGGWSVLQAPLLLAAGDVGHWLQQACAQPGMLLPACGKIRLVGDGVSLCAGSMTCACRPEAPCNTVPRCVPMRSPWASWALSCGSSASMFPRSRPRPC